MTYKETKQLYDLLTRLYGAKEIELGDRREIMDSLMVLHPEIKEKDKTQSNK